MYTTSFFTLTAGNSTSSLQGKLEGELSKAKHYMYTTYSQYKCVIVLMSGKYIHVKLLHGFLPKLTKLTTELVRIAQVNTLRIHNILCSCVQCSHHMFNLALVALPLHIKIVFTAETTRDEFCKPFV